MRLLHTSDWHLGRSFHREDLLGAQAAFLDFLVRTVREERVDTVLISGDLYDRALPGVDAVALCNEALTRIAAEGARIVVISGNHDSARRLGFGADLLDTARVHLRTDPARVGVPILTEDASGPVAFYAIPYLEPEAVREELDCTGRGHAAVLTAAMDRARGDLARRSKGTRAVALAHAFVTGGLASESERDISVGGISLVPTFVFDGMHYSALGHLHGSQSLTDRVRYSGSPLPYSFSEAAHTKSVHLVELGPTGAVSVETIPTPVPRVLGRIRGTLEDLLTNAGWGRYEDAWLSVVLTDPIRPKEPMERLRARFPHILVLGFEPEGNHGERHHSYAQRVAGRSDLDIALGFVRHVRGAEADDEETLLLHEALEFAVREPVSGRGA